MPTPAYISIEGKTQGNITQGSFTAESVGNVFVEGHEDEILVQEIDHTVTVPTDPQSGQAAGPRVHKAFSFTCSLNKSVPLLYNSLTSGETLPKVEVNGIAPQWKANKSISSQRLWKMPPWSTSTRYYRMRKTQQCGLYAKDQSGVSVP